MTPEQALKHCLKHGRNEELENIISTDPYYAYYYARQIINGRWLEAEKIIINDPIWAYEYAQNIIKGRWKEAENIIAKDPFYAFFYAKNIMKGKLPENMHNMMLLHADVYAKEYLEFINNLTPTV